ncbi:hypothetical protein DFQ27_007819 [Actinomortierella ambigua]|uniref:MARVEL domain-containing protein n=1 Tax=Actinomortierella ambigua TaxID=1343610 RepID=A0A9P6TZ62_9FUNG|nr:hypothetical protein DFQ27_007819 [Actinomortierella ambigua]
MSALTKTTKAVRAILIFFAGLAFGGCIWMQLIFMNNHTVIFRWKYPVEYALSGLTFFVYLFSFLFRRLSRVRSLFTSIIYAILGTLWGIAWLYISLAIVSTRRRQMFPVDYPTRIDRDLIDGRDWSDYRTQNDDNMFQCDSDPKSSLGSSLSLGLCNLDHSVAAVGAICGILVLIENALSCLAEQAARRESRRDQFPYEQNQEVELTVKQEV